MVDLPAKTRHAVEMAIAARALARAAPAAHRSRVLARYVFIYLHDVVRFAPSWRNALRQDPRTRATAEAAKPALDRLRQDWEKYEDVRHYLAAKRQPRDAGDRAADQLSAFRLWADIGELSVEVLTDDAIEIYIQLAALDGLPPINAEPVVPDDVATALRELDPIGEEAFLEATASSFGAAKPGALPISMGGEIGRRIPLINDVADCLATLQALLPAVEQEDQLRRLVVCQFPAELNEILRLTVGPAPSVLLRAADTESLLAYYRRTSRLPDVVDALQRLRESISDRTFEDLLNWRNQLGAHIDAEVPWGLLDEGIRDMQIEDCRELWEHIDLHLAAIACHPGGPVLLLLEGGRFKSLASTVGYEQSLSYTEDGGADPGNVLSTVPPSVADSEHVIWTAGPQGSLHSAAVAGMIAGRSREVQARIERANRAHQGRG